MQANYPAKSTASVKPTTPGKKTVQPEENHSPGKAALPAAKRSPALQAHIFLEGYNHWDGPSAVPTRPKIARAPPTSTVPTEENNPDDVLTVPTRQTSARAPSEVNVNSVQSLTIRNLQASLTQLQKKTTAELAAARKKGEEGAARLNALEAQMSRVFPPATNKGRAKGKSGTDVLLETRVSELEKAGAVHTSTARSKATRREVNGMAVTLNKATREIARLQLEASVAAPAAENVQVVALQVAVDSNNTRIAVMEAAIQTLASFQTQLVDLQQKVSTIEVSMSPAAPESNYSHRPTAPKRQKGKRVETRGSMGGDAGTSGESTPAPTPRKKSRSKKSSRHRSRTRSRTRSRSRSSARGRSTETSPRKTTPSKRYDVCMTCV